jgi:two-component system, OmpR family, sensor histidine kinase BaeS
MNLRNKLILAISAAVAASMLGAALSLYVVERGYLLRQRESVRVHTLDRLAEVGGKAILQKNDLVFLDYVRTLLEDPEVATALLTDPEGNILAHGDFIRGEFSSAGQRWSGPVAERTRDVFVAGRLAGRVHLVPDEVASARGLRRALNEAMGRFLGVTGLGLGLGVLLAVILGGALTRPLSSLSQAASRVGKGDLSVELKPEGKDEIAHLTSVFNDMVGQLRRLEELKDEFFSKASHDLRTPVASILSNAELIQEKSPEEPIKTYVSRIHGGASFLSALSTNLLDWAKLKAGRADFHLEVVEPSVLTLEVLEAAQGQAQGYGVALENRVPTDAPAVRADRQAFQRVLMNLLTNALKFTPSGGKVSVSSEMEGGMLWLQVKDTGVGIPDEKLKTVFERFSQVEETKGKVRKVSGTGLGLAIAKEIVEAHGGRIKVESRFNEGSTFSFSLPLIPR